MPTQIVGGDRGEVDVAARDDHRVSGFGTDETRDLLADPPVPPVISASLFLPTEGGEGDEKPSTATWRRRRRIADAAARMWSGSSCGGTAILGERGTAETFDLVWWVRASMLSICEQGGEERGEEV